MKLGLHLTMGIINEQEWWKHWHSNSTNNDHAMMKKWRTFKLHGDHQVMMGSRDKEERIGSNEMAEKVGLTDSTQIAK